MKKLLVTCVAFCGYVVSAGAADLSVFAPRPLLAARPIYSWTGCHIGGNIGGGKAPTSVHDTSGRYGPAGANLSTQDVPGVAGGGQAGCDYQFGPLVFGFRGLYDLTGMNDETLLPSGVFWNYTDVKWIATATGRIGFTVQPTMLLYLNAGAAWSRSVFDIIILPGITDATGSHTAAGWTVGGGFEWAFFANNWSAFLEFDYLDFGSSRTTFTSGIAPAVGFPVDITQKAYLFLFGINYRFFGGARY